jgi:PBP1b-binding outer membrane lipoprotein LpoB
MKKVKNYTFLIVCILLLVGCMGDEKGELTRVDARKMNPDGNYGATAMITDNKSVGILKLAFEQVKWEPNVIVNMVRKADVKATLFFKFDENMPERLFEYEIWFVENSGTANIVSNNEKEGYGELDKDSAANLKNVLLNKIKEWEEN